MAKYLYNGIELPELPDWDKTAFPYAVIVLKNAGSYSFVACSKPYSYGTIPGFSFEAVWADYNNAYQSYRASEDLSQFELVYENDNNSGYFTACKPSDGEALIWTNTYILNADGSVYLASSDPVPVAKYLYNGIELPAFPEYDKTAYPHALINLVNGVYYFRVYSERIYHNNGTLTFQSGSASTLYSKLVDNEWQAFKSSTVTTQTTANLVWTNQDIVRMGDGTVYFAGSAPVPVAPGTPEPTILENDFYKVVNRQWVKHSAVKPVGSEWVKQPQKGYETQEGQWSALS